MTQGVGRQAAVLGEYASGWDPTARMTLALAVITLGLVVAASHEASARIGSSRPTPPRFRADALSAGG